MRIRTVKPEWLEDEKIALASDGARILSIALILLSDDYGRGRGSAAYIGSRVWPSAGGRAVEIAERAIGELRDIGFLNIYVVRGQTYFEILNWTKHQRVDRPGNPRVPAPNGAEGDAAKKADREKVTYFIRGATTGLVKIGESVDPVSRLCDLAACGSEPLELLAVCNEKECDLHREFSRDRVHGEWFKATEAIHAKIRVLNENFPEPLAIAGYDNGRRALTTIHGLPANFRVEDATDHDLDHDLERGPLRARGREALSRAAATAQRITASGSLSGPGADAPTAAPSPVGQRGLDARRIWERYRSGLEQRADKLPGLRVPADVPGAERPVSDVLRAGKTAEAVDHALDCYLAELDLTGEIRWVNPSTMFSVAHVERVEAISVEAHVAAVKKAKGITAPAVASRPPKPEATFDWTGEGEASWETDLRERLEREERERAAAEAGGAA